MKARQQHEQNQQRRRQHKIVNWRGRHMERDTAVIAIRLHHEAGGGDLGHWGSDYIGGGSGFSRHHHL
jgi:hypothetical protein